MICSTITAMNVLNLPDFHREWVDLGLVRADDFIPHILKQPEYLSIQILPQAIKQQVVARYTEHVAWLDSFQDPKVAKMHITRNEFASVIPYIQDVDKTALLPDFISYTDKHDALRGVRFRDVFPELGRFGIGLGNQAQSLRGLARQLRAR